MAGRPVAFGYLRAEDPDEDEIGFWRTEIAQFCAAEDYRLATVYCDRGYDGSELARPGFAGLLDALTLPDNTTLVVPDLTHLSEEDAVRDGLLQQVRRTGVCVLVVHDAGGQPDPTNLPGRSVPPGQGAGGEPT